MNGAKMGINQLTCGGSQDQSIFQDGTHQPPIHGEPYSKCQLMLLNDNSEVMERQKMPGLPQAGPAREPREVKGLCLHTVLLQIGKHLPGQFAEIEAKRIDPEKVLNFHILQVSMRDMIKRAAW